MDVSAEAMSPEVYAVSAASPIRSSVCTLSRCMWPLTKLSVTRPPAASSSTAADSRSCVSAAMRPSSTPTFQRPSRPRSVASATTSWWVPMPHSTGRPAHPAMADVADDEGPALGKSCSSPWPQRPRRWLCHSGQARAPCGGIRWHCTTSSPLPRPASTSGMISSGSIGVPEDEPGAGGPAELAVRRAWRSGSYVTHLQGGGRTWPPDSRAARSRTCSPRPERPRSPRNRPAHGGGR